MGYFLSFRKKNSHRISTLYGHRLKIYVNRNWIPTNQNAEFYDSIHKTSKNWHFENIFVFWEFIKTLCPLSEHQITSTQYYCYLSELFWITGSKWTSNNPLRNERDRTHFFILLEIPITIKNTLAGHRPIFQHLSW